MFQVVPDPPDVLEVLMDLLDKLMFAASLVDVNLAAAEAADVLKNLL